jgi:hypothetical protein
VYQQLTPSRLLEYAQDELFAPLLVDKHEGVAIASFVVGYIEDEPVYEYEASFEIYDVSRLLSFCSKHDIAVEEFEVYDPLEDED